MIVLFYQLPPPPPPPPPPDEPPPLDPPNELSLPDDTGAPALEVDDIAPANAPIEYDIVLILPPLYQSGGLTIIPSKTFIHLPSSPNATAYGNNNEKICWALFGSLSNCIRFFSAIFI